MTHPQSVGGLKQLLLGARLFLKMMWRRGVKVVYTVLFFFFFYLYWIPVSRGGGGEEQWPECSEQCYPLASGLFHFWGEVRSCKSNKSSSFCFIFQSSISRHSYHGTPLRASFSLASAQFMVAGLREARGGSCEGQGALYSCSVHCLDLQTGVWGEVQVTKYKMGRVKLVLSCDWKCF